MQTVPCTVVVAVAQIGIVEFVKTIPAGQATIESGAGFSKIASPDASCASVETGEICVSSPKI